MRSRERPIDFYGVQVGAVWRQEEEPGADTAQGRCGTGVLVAGQVVENNHIAGPQCRRQLGFDVKGEHFGIHRPVDDPRGVEAIMAQGRDKGLGPPVAERRVIDKALAARRPTGGLGHVCLD